MTLAEVPLLVLLVGLVAYAVLAGADFGAGFWQMTPGRGEREASIREHARKAITPVWEANHVWLILVITVCWTCYPEAFAAIASTLAVPLTIAMLGIVLRAVAYVLRGQTRSVGAQRPVEMLFGVSSIVTPFALAAAIGGVASGRVPPGNARGDLVTSWLNGTSIAVGILAVVMTVYVAAVWLAADAARLDRPALVEAFRLRALVAAIVAGAVAFGSLIVVKYDAERLWSGLSSWPAVAAIAVSGLAGAAAIGLLATRRLEPARAVSVVAVAAVIAGWALAQRPEFLPGVTIAEAAAGRATLVAVLIGLAVGSLILIPSLALLFRLVLRGTFDAGAQSGERALPGHGSPLGDAGRAPALCLVGLAAGALTLVVGDQAWSIAVGAALLLVAGACGFAVVARSLAAEV
ncbi:MAG: cytochrome bd ubiquinol oxidase subunit [Gaiellales bacterium]|nr:cytochrome bd ubiquinol oxidase subunit [Gaiellales bacterium]